MTERRVEVKRSDVRSLIDALLQMPPHAFVYCDEGVPVVISCVVDVGEVGGHRTVFLE